MQSLPLEVKIEMSKRRIKEWYEHWDGNVCISFSGGKDSTVLMHLIRTMYPDVPAIFVDTGLEYPEIREFVDKQDNVQKIKPKLSFRQVIKEYGYPVISKEVSLLLYYAKHSKAKSQNYINALNGKNIDGSDSKFKARFKKYARLLDADFPCSSRCCAIMKEDPLRTYQHANGLKPYIGTLAAESVRRTQAWVKAGCNTYDKNNEASKPLSFWTEQDILRYLTNNEIAIATVYGDIVTQDGQLKLTGVDRTGCMFCMFGVHLDDPPNKFQRMRETHPKQYEYCLRDVEDGGLGLAKVLDCIGIKYE